MKKLSLVTFSLILSASSLSAKVTVESTKAARELMVAMDRKAQMVAGFDAMMPAITQMTASLGLDKEQEKELTMIFKDWFLNDLDLNGMQEEIVKIYADKFTAAELKQLADFYKTPLGKKTLALLPEITKLSAQIGMKEAQGKQHLLQERLKPFLESVK